MRRNCRKNGESMRSMFRHCVTRASPVSTAETAVPQQAVPQQAVPQ